MPNAERIAAMEAEINRLWEIIHNYREAAIVDATMEGPRLRHVNLRDYRHAWEADWRYDEERGARS